MRRRTINPEVFEDMTNYYDSLRRVGGGAVYFITIKCLPISMTTLISIRSSYTERKDYLYYAYTRLFSQTHGLLKHRLYNLLFNVTRKRACGIIFNDQVKTPYTLKCVIFDLVCTSQQLQSLLLH